MGIFSWLTSCSDKSSKGSTDINIVDHYLTKWNEFAENGADPSYHLGERYAEFESALVRMLQSGDKRAPSRFVFYQLVQVGGFIKIESPLSVAFATATGGSCPTTRIEGKPEMYFAGDLYFWWLDHGKEFEPMPLMDDWLAGDFAKSTAIPMYTGVRKQSDGK